MYNHLFLLIVLPSTLSSGLIAGAGLLYLMRRRHPDWLTAAGLLAFIGGACAVLGELGGLTELSTLYSSPRMALTLIIPVLQLAVGVSGWMLFKGMAGGERLFRVAYVVLIVGVVAWLGYYSVLSFPAN